MTKLYKSRILQEKPGFVMLNSILFSVFSKNETLNTLFDCDIFPPRLLFGPSMSSTKVDFSIEIHDDGSKELDAGLRPLDHYKQVSRPSSRPP